MRRVILAVTGTVAGLVALLTFRAHVPSTAPLASTGSTGSGTTSGSGTAGGTGGSATVAAGEFHTVTPVTAGERAVNGKVATTAYGPVQVQLVVKNTRIVGVNILEQPTNTLNDLQIGKFAFPQLIKETITAQKAKIDAVSGASYTSAGYIKSLQTAIDNEA